MVNLLKRQPPEEEPKTPEQMLLDEIAAAEEFANEVAVMVRNRIFLARCKGIDAGLRVGVVKGQNLAKETHMHLRQRMAAAKAEMDQEVAKAMERVEVAELKPLEEVLTLDRVVPTPSEAEGPTAVNFVNQTQESVADQIPEFLEENKKAANG